MKKIFFIAAAALSVTACQLDDNIDPNLPSTNDVTPRQLITAAETRSYDAQTTGMVMLSNIWTNVWAGNEYYFAAPMSREYQMDVKSNFYTGIWDQNYLAIANIANIINNPQASKFPLHVAVAKILMANSMQYIVDFYGDAPYTEAFQGQNNLSPKYDKGEDIYRDLIVKLNEAIATIDNTPENDANRVRPEEDVVFSGEMTLWKQFANTIKLRLLLRESKVTDVNVVNFRNAQLQSLQNAVFINQDVTIQPGYSNATNSNMNPLAREYGWLDYTDEAYNTYGYRYIDLSDHMAKLLTGSSDKTAGVVDKRGTKMYRPVGGTLKGIVQGGGKVSGGTEAGFSRLGWKYYDYSANNGKMDGYLMLKSESLLLQAEAAVLYPAIFTGAQMKYDQAVTASFEFFGLTATDAANYRSSLDSRPYGWMGATDKIAAIQYQRLVALNLVRPMETYLNYLKTGYPETPLALTAQQPNKPWRLIYPTSEYVGNSANVPAMTTPDVFVKNKYTPFWLR